MSVIATCRTAMADALNGIASLRAVAYVTDQVNVNQATVARKEINYDLAMARGGDVYDFTVTVYAARTDDKAAQEFLDLLCEPSGATSLKTTLETQTVWNAAGVDYIRVKTASETKVAAIGPTEYLTVDFELEAVT